MPCMSVSQPFSIVQEAVKNWSKMQKKICFALSLIVCYWAKASPAKLGSLDFDKLGADLDDLKYDVGEEDLDDFSKLLDADASGDREEKSKTKVNTGIKKFNTARKNLKTKYNIEDLKKFFKAVGIKDRGSYSEGDIHAAVAALAAEAVGAQGTEQRKYRKGTKTRGFHNVHHKDEYKKNKKFYEDDEVSGDIKKVGGKALGYEIDVGAGFNKGFGRQERKKGIYGKEGYLGKGSVDKEYSGYSDAHDYDDSFENDSY